MMPHVTSNLRDDTYIPSTRGSWSTGAPKGSMSGYTRDSLHMVLPSNSAENNYYITSKSLLQMAPVHRHVNASMATLKLHSSHSFWGWQRTTPKFAPWAPLHLSRYTTQSWPAQMAWWQWRWSCTQGTIFFWCTTKGSYINLGFPPLSQSPSSWTLAGTWFWRWWSPLQSWWTKSTHLCK